jgi:hypothetical protein
LSFHLAKQLGIQTVSGSELAGDADLLGHHLAKVVARAFNTISIHRFLSGAVACARDGSFSANKQRGCSHILGHGGSRDAD